MSQKTTNGSPEPTTLAQVSQPADADGGVAAPPHEILEAKIRRAKEIIGGRRRPDPLIMSPWVTQFLEHEREKGQLQGLEPTKEALREITDWLNLQAHYGGRPVACFTTDQGVITVLAEGQQEIDALFERLAPEEAAEVVVEYPEQPVGFGGPSSTASPTSS